MPNFNAIKIALVDDHQIVIDGLAALLNGYPEIDIVASENDGLKMLKILDNKAVDVLLTDVMMPIIDGKELAKSVKNKFPNIKIIALSMSDQVDTVSEMINDANIAGYLLKQTNIEELVLAIKKVKGGETYFQDQIINALSAQNSLQEKVKEINITLREKEIIKLIEKDLSNKQIADQLFISIRTVETHRKNIFNKTGTNNTLSLVKWAYEHKVI